MPLITIELPKTSNENKRKLVKQMAESTSQILDVPLESIITIIKENELENIGAGSNLMSEKLW
ncbi:MAG: tautomerase family protein [Bacteroidia bacterium]|nr:tautomerase family protein [Bacteroidia bacterium]